MLGLVQDVKTSFAIKKLGNYSLSWREGLYRSDNLGMLQNKQAGADFMFACCGRVEDPGLSCGPRAPSCCRDTKKMAETFSYEFVWL